MNTKLYAVLMLAGLVLAGCATLENYQHFKKLCEEGGYVVAIGEDGSLHCARPAQSYDKYLPDGKINARTRRRPLHPASF